MTVEKAGMRILVMNLLGNLLMKDESTSPFKALDAILAEAGKHDLSLLDIHAETTSEKEALGHYADGRVTAVVGSHTHVPTADHKLLPGGTAYVTDVGRNGGHHSVVGFEKNAAIQRFLDPAHRAYDPQKAGLAEANAVLIAADPATGKATAIERLRKIVDI
jgi:calcineurin-like phosphoesterase